MKELIGLVFTGDKEGIGFQEFRERFLAEVGHPLDIELWGYLGMKDFIMFGVPDILELDLDLNGVWKIVPVGNQGQANQSRHDGEGELVTPARGSSIPPFKLPETPCEDTPVSDSPLIIKTKAMKTSTPTTVPLNYKTGQPSKLLQVSPA